MDCPKCGANMADCVGVELVSDAVNEFGRSELVWTATHVENVHWVGDHYHCSKCGQDFSSDEGIFQ